MEQVLKELSAILEARKHADAQGSYVAGLYAQGTPSILRKVGEEAIEVVIAGQGQDDEALVHETADLWFHTMILLAHRGMGPDRVLDELARRFGQSGIEEKRRRAK